MKQMFRSAVALALAYAMIIGSVGGEAFSAVAMAAEGHEAFASEDGAVYEETEEEDAFAGNPAVSEETKAKQDIFGDAVYEPDTVSDRILVGYGIGSEAGESQILTALTEEESESEAVYHAEAADGEPLTIKLADGVNTKFDYEPGGKIKLEFDLKGATFLDKNNELVSVTQKTKKIEKEVTAYVGKGTLKLSPGDIEFNESGYVLAETAEIPYEIAPIDETPLNGLILIPALKAGKTVNEARLRKAVKIDADKYPDIKEDKDKWTFELVSATQAPGVYENGVFTAVALASRTQVTIKATYPEVDVNGDGTAEYNAASTLIEFSVDATLSQNLRFKKESEFVDGVYEVENSVGALYDLSAESDDRQARKYYSSSDESIVKIDASTGIMSPGKNGEAIVTVRSVGGGSYGTEELQVTVKTADMVTWLEPQYNNVTLGLGASIEIPVTVEPAKTTTEALLVTAASATQRQTISESTSITVKAADKPGFSIVRIKADDKRGAETCILVQTVADINDAKNIIDISHADPEAIKDLANYDADKIKDVLFKKNEYTGLYEPNLWVGGYKSSYEYTGAAIKPEPNVYEGLKRLIQKQDYTLSYGKNKTVSQGGTIKVKFKGNYKGAARIVYFTITPVNLGDPDSVAAGDVVAATISPSTAPVIYLLGSGAVIKKYNSSTGLMTTFDKASSEGSDGFIGTVTIKPRSTTGNFTGETTVKVYNVNAIDNIGKRKFTIKTVDYTDSAIGVSGRYIEGWAQIKSSNGGKCGIDYEVIGVANNVKPGTASVYIRGIGATKRGSKKVTFKIRKKSKTLKDGARFIQSNKQVVSGTQASRLQIMPGVYSGLAVVSGLNALLPVDYEDNAVYYAAAGAKASYYAYDIDTGRRLMEGIDYKLSFRKKIIQKIDMVGQENVTRGKEKLWIKGAGGYSDLYDDCFEPAYKILPVPLDEESGLVVVAVTGKLKKDVAIYSRIDGSKFGTAAFSFSGSDITPTKDANGVPKGLSGSRRVTTNSALGALKLNPATYTGTYITGKQLDIKTGGDDSDGATIELANNIAASKNAIAVYTKGSAARAVKFTISKLSAADKKFTGIAIDGKDTTQ